MIGIWEWGPTCGYSSLPKRFHYPIVRSAFAQRIKISEGELVSLKDLIVKF